MNAEQGDLPQKGEASNSGHISYIAP